MSRSCLPHCCGEAIALRFDLQLIFMRQVLKVSVLQQIAIGGERFIKSTQTLLAFGEAAQRLRAMTARRRRGGLLEPPDRFEVMADADEFFDECEPRVPVVGIAIGAASGVLKGDAVEFLVKASPCESRETISRLLKRLQAMELTSEAFAFDILATFAKGKGLAMHSLRCCEHRFGVREAFSANMVLGDQEQFANRLGFGAGELRRVDFEDGFFSNHF